MMKRTMIASEKAQRQLKRVIQNGISTKKLLLLGGVALLAILGVTMSSSVSNGHRRLPGDLPADPNEMTFSQYEKKYGVKSMSLDDCRDHSKKLEKEIAAHKRAKANGTTFEEELKKIVEADAATATEKNRAEAEAEARQVELARKKELARQVEQARQEEQARREQAEMEARKTEEAAAKAKYDAAMTKDVQAHRREIHNARLNRKLPYAKLNQESCKNLARKLKCSNEGIFSNMWWKIKRASDEILITVPLVIQYEAMKYAESVGRELNLLKIRDLSFAVAADDLEEAHKDLLEIERMSTKTSYAASALVSLYSVHVKKEGDEANASLLQDLKRYRALKVQDLKVALQQRSDGSITNFHQKYTLTNEELGAGAGGVVFRCIVNKRIGKHLRAGDEVACKLGNPSDTDKHLRWALSGLTREVIIGKTLVHPNICPIYEMFWDDAKNTSMVTMPYLDGVSLDKICQPTGCEKFPFKKNHLIPAKDLCSMMLGISHGLGFLHANGVVQHDVKLENMMLLESGTIKIIDFGGCSAMTKKNLRIDQYKMGYVFYQLLLRTRYSTHETDHYGKPDRLERVEKLQKTHPQYAPLVRLVINLSRSKSLVEPIKIIEVLEHINKDMESKCESDPRLTCSPSMVPRSHSSELARESANDNMLSPLHEEPAANSEVPLRKVVGSSVSPGASMRPSLQNLFSRCVTPLSPASQEATAPAKPKLRPAPSASQEATPARPKLCPAQIRPALKRFGDSTPPKREQKRRVSKKKRFWITNREHEGKVVTEAEVKTKPKENHVWVKLEKEDKTIQVLRKDLEEIPCQ